MQKLQKILNVKIINTNAIITQDILREKYGEIKLKNYFDFDDGFIKKKFNEKSEGLNKKQLFTKVFNEKNGFKNQVTLAYHYKNTEKFNLTNNFHLKNKNISRIKLYTENFILDDEIKIIASIKSFINNFSFEEIKFKVTQEDIDRGFIEKRWDRIMISDKISFNTNNKNFVVEIDNHLEVSSSIFVKGNLKITGNVNDDVFIKIAEKSIKLFDKNSKVTGIAPVLLNSTFDFGQNLDRDAIYQIFKNEDFCVTYDNSVSSAVNIKYFTNDFNDGKCHCQIKCTRSSNKYHINSCGVITVLVFSSGKINITGKETFENFEKVQKIIHDTILKNIHVN